MLDGHRPRATTAPLGPSPALQRRQDAVTTASSLTFSDLFPTATHTASATNGTSTESSQPTGKSSTSLYLIVFLSILVVLLVTSIGVALRAIHLRRRFRSEIQLAIARGSIHPWQAEELTRQREADAWGLGRWAGWSGWDGVAALEGTRDGRRRRERREKKRLGPRPVLWEVEAKERGEKEEEGESEAGMANWTPFSAQAIPLPGESIPGSALGLAAGNPGSSTSITAHPRPFTPSSRAPPTPQLDAAQTVEGIFNPSSSETAYRRTGRRMSRPSDDESFVVPGGGRGMPSRRRSRSRSADRLGVPASERSRSASRLPALDTVLAGHRGDGTDSGEPTPRLPAASLPGLAPGQRVQAGFMVRMPERPDARDRRERRAVEDDEPSHPPMEIGIWTGTVQDVRFEDADEEETTQDRIHGAPPDTGREQSSLGQDGIQP